MLCHARNSDTAVPAAVGLSSGMCVSIGHRIGVVCNFLTGKEAGARPAPSPGVFEDFWGNGITE